MNWGALLGFLLVAMLTPADVAQAQLGTKATGSINLAGPPIREYPRFDPPGHYQDLYFAAIQCSGAYGNIPLFQDIVWLKAPGADFPPPPNLVDRVRLRGLWQGNGGPPDTIVIAADMKESQRTVKHELIHYVLQTGHLPSKAADDSLWGIACRAKAGFSDPADTVVSKPGATSYYGRQ